MVTLFDLAGLRQAVIQGRIEWRKHTLQRIAERYFLQKEVIQILLSGEIIREYLDDRPFPSALVFDWVADRPVHVVASYDKEADIVYIITVYEPSLDAFEGDFKTKRK